MLWPLQPISAKTDRQVNRQTDVQFSQILLQMIEGFEQALALLEQNGFPPGSPIFAAGHSLAGKYFQIANITRKDV